MLILTEETRRGERKTGTDSFQKRCLSVHLMLLGFPQAALVINPGESSSSADFDSKSHPMPSNTFLLSSSYQNSPLLLVAKDLPFYRWLCLPLAWQACPHHLLATKPTHALTMASLSLDPIASKRRSIPLRLWIHEPIKSLV